MTGQLEIRESHPGDRPAILALYPAAFPDEDLLPLLNQLLDLDTDILSLVALSDGALAGHVIFTRCRTEPGSASVALLGPLAVAPNRQRQGVGGSLIEVGLQQLETGGTARVCVLGDPGYYGRFGFTREDAVTPPYPLPAQWDGAWQSVHLKEDHATVSGALQVPGPWQNQALWAP